MKLVSGTVTSTLQHHDSIFTFSFSSFVPECFMWQVWTLTLQITAFSFVLDSAFSIFSCSIGHGDLLTLSLAHLYLSKGPQKRSMICDPCVSPLTSAASALSPCALSLCVS